MKFTIAKTILSVAALGLLTVTSQADVTISIVQNATGVDLSYSGTLNLSGTSITPSASASSNTYLRSGFGQVWNMTSAHSVYSNMLSVDLTYGTDTSGSGGPSSRSGDTFGIYGKTLYIAGNLTTGQSIAGAMSWDGRTFASMGITPNLNLSATLSGTSETIYLTTGAVPEPSTYAAIAGLAVLGFGLYHRRRARA